MDEPKPEPKPEPTITLTLSELKIISMGFRYVPPRDDKSDIDTKEKCVLPPSVLAKLRKVEGYESHFHIQETGEKSLPFVWDIDDWKAIGEYRQELAAKSEKRMLTGNRLFEILRPKFPSSFDGNLLKALCNEWAVSKPDLSNYGIVIDYDNID